MLSICRLVPFGHGHGDLQEMERYREIDFPIAGPSEATDRQKDVFAEALNAISHEDHESLSGAQIVLVSSKGRIVAVENLEQRGCPTGFTWADDQLVVPQRLMQPQGSEELPEMPTFMCEKQAASGNELPPNCFEILDSLGRSWSVYQVQDGLMNPSDFPEMDGLEVCQREDLAERLGRV